jgi:hypothetical protein
VSRTEQRAAIVGFLGAVLGATLGGLAAFAGEYFASESERERELLELQRQTYVEVERESSQYRRALTDLDLAVSLGDQGTYEGAKTTLRAAETELATVVGAAFLVLDDPELASQIQKAYFDTEEPELVTEYDLDRLRRALEAGDDARDAFLQDGRTRIREALED